MPSEKKPNDKDQVKKTINPMVGRAYSFIRRNAPRRLMVESMKNTPNFYLDVQKNQGVVKSKFDLGYFSTTSNIDNLAHVNIDFRIPLTKLKLNNIKSFKEASFTPSNLNLFAGKNSSGKSTILETLALLSNWSHTQNTVYDGVPFKYDFGIKNLEEFKSIFADENEPISIELQATNILEPMLKNLGNANLKLLLDEDSEKLNDLKFAPIKYFKIHFDNKLAFNFYDQELEDLKFTPVNTEIVYVNKKNKSQDLQIPLEAGLELMATHSEKLKKIMEGIDDLQLEDNFQNFNGHNFFDFDPTLASDFSFSFYEKKKQNKIKKELKVENSLDKYVDINVSTEEDGFRKTRLYGCSFSSGEKTFNPVNSEVECYLNIDKTFLIRWLAIDFITQISKSKKTEVLEETLPDYRELIHDELKTGRFSNIIKKEIKSTRGANPPIKSLELITDTILVSLFDMNLKANQTGQYSFLGIFDFPSYPYERARQNIYKEINLNNLIDWIQRGEIAIDPIRENAKNRVEQIKKSITFKDEDVSNFLKVFDDHSSSSLEILRFADMAILGLSQQGSDANQLLKDMYKNIENFCKDKEFKISVYEEWDNIKYYLLETLACNTSLNSSEIDNNKNALIPFHTKLLHKFHGASLFSNINYSLKQSLENTFTTIFVGPLRERSEFKDDIFSYEFPFTLGIKGEKSASFLSTFKNNQINFPTPQLIKDIDTGNMKNLDTYIKFQTYTDHLSDWLKFLGLAEKIQISNAGKIQINQGSIGESGTTLENIGVGVSQVLPVLLSCMTSQKNENNEILLLEQPELHLHPSAQAKLADFFIAVSVTNKKTLFVETHSEHILNRLRLRKIQLRDINEFIKIFFSTKQTNGQTTIEEFSIKDDGSYDFDRYPDGFFDQTQLEAREIAKALIEEKDKQ